MVVAKQIAEQIGNKALFMIGAKNLAGTKNSLVFKIGRNSKKVNYIRITLNAMDLYDVEYMKVTTKKSTTLYTDNGLYNDMLNKSIEENTGMYTSL